MVARDMPGLLCIVGLKLEDISNFMLALIRAKNIDVNLLQFKMCTL
jgi:hypothetical protein